MQNFSLNQQKLVGLIIAAVALIFMLLNWSNPTKSMHDAEQLAQAFGVATLATVKSQNGFHGWGFISLAGALGVVFASFMGDKTKAYEGQNKMIASASFAAISLGALIFLIYHFTGSMSNAQGEPMKLKEITNTGIGLYLCLLTGLAGIVWVMQLIKMNNIIKSVTTPHPPPPPSVK